MPYQLTKKSINSFSAQLLLDDDEIDHVHSTVHVDNISARGRERYQAVPLFTPPSPQKRVTNSSCATEDASESFESCEEHESHASRSHKRDWEGRKKPSATPDRFMQDWMDVRDVFLVEILRLEGSRGRAMTCSHCGVAETIVRCRDCSGDELLCRRCCLSQHSRLPFHRILEYNGKYFGPQSLQNIGLVLQLGHTAGETCSNPSPGPTDFMVMHTNGVHSVTVQFCRCDHLHLAGNHIQQLLRYELYPATITEPTTCATFRMLESFHLLTLQSKITAYDYYLTLNHLTDNTGVRITWDRFKPFLRMVRQWRMLKMFKRFGRGHEEGGVVATTKGGLCLRCPACPQPDENLPEGWDCAAPEMKYLYTLILAIDANFRLKRRAISSTSKDPALGSGLGYFVEDVPYQAHCLLHADQEDISTCTGFAALTQANTKYHKGYAVTGVGMVVCARHGFIFPNAVGDLQKGERYCNMDYIVASTLALRGKSGRLILSYDIACQWAVHLKERLALFPPHLQVNLPEGQGELRLAIPKYHFAAHKEKGHNQYSLHLMPGVGRSCGEQIERNWPKHSETAASTREMGPGNRHDTLEDHFGYANWRVYVTLGRLLQRLSREAVKESAAQEEIFSMFCEKLQPENVATWVKEVEAFERDPTRTDPYYRESAGVSEAEIRLQLAEEEDQAIENGDMSFHEITPSVMLIEMLEIEEHQRRFNAKYPAAVRSGVQAGTAHQTAEMIKKRAAIRRRLATLRNVQALYMPCVALQISQRLRTLDEPGQRTLDNAVAFPENDPLFFPHDIDIDELERCHPGLAELEERLRNAQLNDALDKLRIQLHVKTRLIAFKNRNIRHQKQNTRARRQIEVNEDKIIALAEKYRAARKAKLALCGHGTWEREWRELLRSDVRTLSSTEDPRWVLSSTGDADNDTAPTLSEGRRQVSWIWTAADKDGDNLQDSIQDALRVEFLRSRARALRFREQLQLLSEEKRRVLQSMKKQAETWDRRWTSESMKKSSIEAEGCAMYAAKQADIRRSLYNAFSAIWQPETSVDVACVEESDDGMGGAATYDSDESIGLSDDSEAEE